MLSSADNKKMEEGVQQILGKKPYKSIVAPIPCVHDGDGHIYDETASRLTLRCYKCGEFYDERKH